MNNKKSECGTAEAEAVQNIICSSTDKYNSPGSARTEPFGKRFVRFVLTTGGRSWLLT